MRSLSCAPLCLLALAAAAACSPDGMLGPSATLKRGDADASAVVVTSLPGVCDWNPTEADLTGPGWTRAFNEEFSGDLAQWSTWYGGAWNDELQMYQADNLASGDGFLTITARKETAVGPTNPYDATPAAFGYTSGRIESLQHFSASRATPQVRFAARIRLPEGYGMWPAFWTYGDPWPTQGEIDILEARGNEPFEYHTAYWFGRRPGVNTVSGSESSVQSAVSLMSCWHVYEVIWTQNALTYRFDGSTVAVKTGSAVGSMFRKSQRLTLNLAVGGLFFPELDEGAIQTGTMQVDWVKVFTAR